ncbi:MAG: polynucleotide kinase-phosphatase [Flammeovirgaceae bacterium]
MEINIPELALIALVGASSSGKSTFAKKHFKPTEVISSDFCRALVADDENSMSATQDAFDVLHYIAAKRLKRGMLTVVDATNVQKDARKPILQLAKEYYCLPVAIVLHLPLATLKERHRNREDRDFPDHVIRNHHVQLIKSIRQLKKEGFKQIHILDSEEKINKLIINRQPLWNNKKHEHGPFDIIGDVHGCFDELQELLETLGYQITQLPKSDNYGYKVIPPEGRKAFFVGDLVDRGPKSPEVLRLVMSMVKDGVAMCVPGNHDVKLQKKLSGKNVNLKHGLAETMEQLAHEPESFVEEVKEFIYTLVSHHVLDDGKLVIAHAGLREEMQGRASGIVRAFCLYGETTGEIDQFGLPVRYNWATEYKGKAMVVYGHTPVPEAEWLNNTIDIDTGCVFGGKLTALRYPERELVAVPAKAMYCEPVKPLQAEQESTQSAQQEYDDVLDIADVTGKRYVETPLGNVLIREENSIAALEVMSRFAIHPKWLMHLPPTMSPTATSDLPDLLEHPKEAFEYYRNAKVPTVVIEEKHMGSRAVVIVCQNPSVAQSRFGLVEAAWGVCYTRTGRAFFKDAGLEQQFLALLNEALSKANFWEKQQTDWVCLDCELMPWSAKAQELIKKQYAAVGASSKHALKDSVNMLEKAKARGLEIDVLLESYRQKQLKANQYVTAYQAYCRVVNGIEGLKLAPFHILATEGKVHTDKAHTWHMETIAEFCAFNTDLLLATPYKVVELDDEKQVEEAIQWWTDLTEKGGEGMVVKPLDFIVRNEKGIVQPAIKCRGKEYLRIIYGLDYDVFHKLERLKKRGLGRKRAMAIKEFTLGIEALNRFVRKEPLRRTHECVFGVLALESEPVDPRL